MDIPFFSQHVCWRSSFKSIWLRVLFQQAFATAQQGNNWNAALFWLIQELHAQRHVKRKRKCESGYLSGRGLINWLSLTLNHPPGARWPFDASKLTTLGWWHPLTTPVLGCRSSQQEATVEMSRTTTKQRHRPPFHASTIEAVTKVWYQLRYYTYGFLFTPFFIALATPSSPSIKN